MLESVDLKAKMPKAEFKKLYSELEIRLGELQRTIRSAQIPVIVVFEGWEASGVGTAIGHLLGPFDPRGYKVHTFIAPTETEKLYPPMWRYWQAMPARGSIAVYDGSWYVQILAKNQKAGRSSVRALMYERIRTLEHQLTDDGTVVLKFWLHISKDEQARRFKKLKKDPAQAWKVTKEDWRRHRQYGRSCQVIEEMLRETSLPNAPWVVVPAHDQRYASARILEGVASAMEQAIRRKSRKPTKAIELAKRDTEPLAKVDLSLGSDSHEPPGPTLSPGVLRVLRESGLSPERLEQIRGAAQRARDLTCQLLAFSRKQILSLAALDLRDVVRGFGKLLRRTIREDIQIELKLPATLGIVEADAGQIEQVLMNLCVNAQDAMPDGGTLAIELRDVAMEAVGTTAEDIAPGDYVLLSVSDTGRGMDQLTMHRLFEPFFTTKERGKGTGLGLSMAYGIIRQHGGRIVARSAPGPLYSQPK